MVRKLFGCAVALGVVIGLFVPTSDHMGLAAEASADRLIEQMARGREFEKDRRWQEAIQLYEKLARKFPDRIDIEQRLQIVRIHFDVTRRYGDATFLATIDRTSPNAVLDLMGEVLTKLQTYYVENIDFSKLLRNGTAFLEVALTEEDFLRHNVAPHIRPEAVEHFRTNIHKSVLGRPVNSIADVRSMVAHASTLARDQIGLPPTAVMYEYISGFIGLLDPYSAYLTAGEYQEIMSQIEGNLIGLGVELWAEGNELRIVEVFPGGPAADAGLLKGDRLIEIGGLRVADVGAKRAADLLRGPENSMVRLIYERPQYGQLSSEVRRRKVDVPSVSSASIVDAAHGIGYLRISNFQKTTTREVDEALRSLYGQGLKSLIIDLRRNPGGLLDAAVEIADRFLFTGPIVTTRGRNGQENHDYFAKTPGTWELPLVVMIDEDSASASEIFAGAIRDQKRGLIVGRTSYGKGSVQGVFHNELAEGGMRLTVSKFFSPSGYAISARGIVPHIPFELDEVVSPSAAQFVGMPTAAAGLRPADGGANSRGSAGAQGADSPNPRPDQEILDLQRAIEVARTELPKVARAR